MIILGSSSKTRASILKAHGIPFIQKGCDFDEDALSCKRAKDFAYCATMGKLRVCEERYGLQVPILCADTVVTAYGQILRKAADEDEALRILRLQSGSCVSIITCTAYKSLKKMFVDLSETIYRFAPFDEADLMRYIESGEWRGKAGACMVEGFCKKYIRSVDGYESCAMGLSIEKLLPWLEKERA